MLNPIDSDRAPDPPDQRQYAPATQRNRDPILVVLQRVLPPTGTILEISSGTGEHAVYFAPRLSPRQWLPSDPNPIARHSIESWRWHEPAENLCAPLAIDVCDPLWAENIAPQVNPQLNLQSNPIQAIVNINMIHIAPWAACLGLMAGAARILPTGGVLYLYGPYQQQGQHTAESNAAFDASLRQQNSDWGVRELEAVVEVAEKQGLQWQETIAMPANNLSVVFCRL